MRLFELIRYKNSRRESGINIEGWKKIQCWETNEDNPIIYCEGYELSYEDVRIYLNREITNVYLYTDYPDGKNEQPCLCIELETDTYDEVCRLYNTLPEKYHDRIGSIKEEDGLIDDCKYMLYLKNGWKCGDGCSSVACKSITEAIGFVKESYQ